ncbi:uncharacterized protein B0I36DRAFT_363039 [Microdochium trichocladiopsis]|uniref:Nuclear pore assembly and biogenesis-domain-containing protein n=1 Tax=Microdochium trichocladiopsis TaxID=1682393 RepID=A0A9P8Y7K1_9PEZI|nr:uncharacterized protein B0I36DRAFT_363039 [Microdochium trichocladiopsis]KAH7031333.1 hypothetical protein B0I36DRAFT_363039 [Microdochium trichocladiopsis]
MAAGFLPENTISFLQDHVLSDQTPVQIIYQQLLKLTRSSLAGVVAALAPIVTPIIDRLVATLSSSPDFVFFGALLFLIVAAIQIALFIQRTMLYFTRLFFRMLGWALVIAAVAAVWQRGPEATARDAVVVVSKLAGYASVVRDIWWSEYQKYDAQTRGQTVPGWSGGAGAGGRASAGSGYRYGSSR